MSYVRSNINIYEMMQTTRSFTDEEVPNMSIEQFDKLTLAEQIHIYNNYPSQYNRLTGRPYEQTATDTATTPQDTTPEQDFAKEFEQRVDEAITRAFHPNGA